MARTSVPREEVARTLTLKFQSRDKSSMVKIRVFVPFPSPQRDTIADEGDLYAHHLHAKGVAVYAARRLEAHVQFAPSTLDWIHGALRALLNDSDVPSCC